VLVVDASVLAPALAGAGADADAARARLSDERLAAPELVDLEVTSVLRRHVLAGRLTADRASRAVSALVALPLRRVAHRPLLPRCWQLRGNLTVYDASYVALAEALGAVLVTADERLAHASGLRCTVEVLGPRV
jgi:predicted nucleic acid-binding protein